MKEYMYGKLQEAFQFCFYRGHWATGSLFAWGQLDLPKVARENQGTSEGFMAGGRGWLVWFNMGLPVFEGNPIFGGF